MGKIFYFTGTGNSLYTAKQISDSLGSCELIDIAKLNLDSELSYNNEDVIGIVCPTVVQDMPKIVTQFLTKSNFAGAGYVFHIQVSGGNVGFALNSAIDIYKGKDLNIKYLTELKYLDNNGKNVFTENQKKEADLNAKKDIQKICEDLKNKSCKIKLLKNKDNKFIRNIGWFMLNKVAKVKNIVCNEDSCKKCGICVKVCPVANISLKDKIEFSNKCESCFACYHTCPTQSLSMGAIKADKDRQMLNLNCKPKDLFRR